MSRVKTSLDLRKIRRLIWLVLTVFVLLGYSLQSAAGIVNYSMMMQPYATVGSPPVILEGGNVTGASTIYANSTSAEINVKAPLFDYVDNNDPDVDFSADKGMHSNFPAQQAGPDSAYDTLTEENTEGIEDYVDNNTSDMDSSQDIGSHSNFESQKAKDSSYDILTETAQANTHSLDATGGYMIIGDGTPDWGSTTGTISFWVKMDISVQGRFYGQDGNMETRWSGTNLVLDWGATASMTSAYSFSADTWYFVAIVWDEINDNLFLYVGDENNAPTLDSNSLSETWTSTTPAPTENRFLNGLGGNEPVDGHGDDLRYWNIARNLTEIQSDYDETLSGSESNLQSYFKLDNNFGDIGPNDDDGSGSGSYSFSTDVSFSGSSDYDLDLEIQWTSVIDFLPTEKLCIYTGTLGDEDLRVDYWNGTGWENLATDLTAYSCNEYTVSLTSVNFTIRFKGGTESNDTTQDQWQIDASLLRVEGAGDKEDAVDSDTSNVDDSDDVGTLSNFDNMKTKDGMANLTEGEVGGGTIWLWQEDTSGYSSTLSYQTYQFWNSWTTNSTTSGTITKIGIYVFANPGNSPQVKLGIYDDSGGSPNNLLGETNATTITGTGWLDLDIVGGGVSISASTTYHLAHITDIAPTSQWRYLKTATPVSDFRNGIAWPNLFDPAGTTSKSSSYRYGAYRVGYDEPSDYRLDQEVQWTDVPYLLPNENLSIYAGIMGDEDIKVDVWNGTDWENVFNDLSTGWNNASITDWLTTSNFTIRFKGGNETGDPSQDTWQIDVALIHIWYEGGVSYEFDLEVQWTSADFTRTNEELCIRTGTFGGSENIQVRVWNNTGSSWHWVMNLTASQWNNVSITSYLTSNTFTVQFLGGTETGDTTQDSWNIDATLLHVWTDDATFNYVLRVNNTETDSWQIRLKKYSDSNINRLQNCTIYFHNSSDGTSRQIYIEDGSYTNQTGPWYDLGGSETIYIAMKVEASSTGTSYVYVYLEILIPDTTTYAQYIITFEIT